MTKEKFLEEVDWIYEQFNQSNKQEIDYGHFEYRLAQLTLNFKTGYSYDWRKEL